ncbi:MAG: SCP2 sterol-binding domain-containing protein [Pseudomonadota bacterium]
MAGPSRERLLEGAASVFARGFNAVLEIVPEGDAAFFVDGRQDECRILTDLSGDISPEEVTTRWRASADTLNRIFQGDRAFERAYLSGRLMISGDMSLMARLHLETSK